MTTTATERAPERAAALRGNPWLPTPSGFALVFRIELLRRRPTLKGYVFFGILFAMMIGMSLLIITVAPDAPDTIPLELLLLMVLGVGMLIGPSLSATSINGDSSDGVLAPLQMTRLTPGDLALGKLFASWLVAVIALVAISPFMLFAFPRSHWSFAELGIVIAVILFEVLVATAIGLAWSAMAARNAVSVALAHVTIGALVLGSLVLFAMSSTLVTETVEVTDRYRDYEQLTPEQENDPNFDYESLPCVEYTYDAGIVHTDRIAWMLLINPAVVITESAPIYEESDDPTVDQPEAGIFALLHNAVSAARLGTGDVPQAYDECSQDVNAGIDTEWEDDWERQDRERYELEPAPGLGLIAHALLGLGCLALAITRLRVPYRKLRGGTRVA